MYSKTSVSNKLSKLTTRLVLPVVALFLILNLGAFLPKTLAANVTTTGYTDNFSIPASCISPVQCTGVDNQTSTFTDDYDASTGLHSGSVAFWRSNDSHVTNGGDFGQNCDYTTTNENIDGFTVLDTAGGVIFTSKSSGVSNNTQTTGGFSWSGVSGSSVGSVVVHYVGNSVDNINDGTGGCYQDGNTYYGQFTKTVSTLVSQGGGSRGGPNGSGTTRGGTGSNTGTSGGNGGSTTQANCGEGQDTITSTYSMYDGTPSQEQRTVNVTLQITTNSYSKGHYNWHYKVFLDKTLAGTDSFTGNFSVYQDLSTANPRLVASVPMQAPKNKTLSALAPVSEGDFSGDSQSADLRAVWNFIYTDNQNIGPSPTEKGTPAIVPGNGSFDLITCANTLNPDFTLGNAGVKDYTPGDWAFYFISVENCAGGFNGPVNNLRISNTNLTGITNSFWLPATISSCNTGSNLALLSFQIPFGTAANSYTMTVSGDGSPGTRTTTLDINVTNPAISVKIAPQNSKIVNGTSINYSLVATLKDGSQVDVTNQSLFSAQNSSLISFVNNTATGLGVGKTKVTGSYGALSDSTNVAVVDYDIRCTVSASFYEGSGRGIFITVLPKNGFDLNVPVTATSNGLNLSQTSGTLVSPNYTFPVFVSGPAGSYVVTLSANYQGSAGGTKNASCQIPITVMPNLSAILITPQSATIPAGNTQNYTVTAKYTDNSTKDVTLLANYTSSNTNIATTNNTRTALGIAPGNANINSDYTENGVTKTDTASLTVTSGGGGVNPVSNLNLDNSLCNQVTISWDPSNQATAYRIYRSVNPLKDPPTASQKMGRDIPSGTTKVVDNSPLDLGGINYYGVTVVNRGTESSLTSASVRVIKCAPDMSKSDKDIVQIANSTIATSPCNGFDYVSIPSTIKPGTSLGFAINICNTGVSATKDITPGTNITVDDQLQNIIGVDPKAITCTKANGTKCNVSNVKITGAAPNERINFKVEHGGIVIGSYVTIKFTGKIADVVNKTPLYKFRNVADIYLDGDKKKTVQTPPFLYVNGSFVPEKQEISP